MSQLGPGKDGCNLSDPLKLERKVRGNQQRKERHEEKEEGRRKGMKKATVIQDMMKDREER